MSEAMLSWLRAQLDEDERVAKEVDPDGRLGSLDDSDDGLESRMWPDHNAVGITACRVLDEVEFKRKILRRYETAQAAAELTEGTTLARAMKVRAVTLEGVLRLMLIPYRDRDGYDPAWGEA